MIGRCPVIKYCMLYVLLKSACTFGVLAIVQRYGEPTPVLILGTTSVKCYKKSDEILSLFDPSPSQRIGDFAKECR